jgi:hypothetical protein
VFTKVSTLAPQHHKRCCSTMIQSIPTATTLTDNLIRGLKVGGAGLTACALLSLTGGVAAPTLAIDITAKMMERTEGLSEFHLIPHPVHQEQLSQCIFISGWIRDELDFQRPWGVKPTVASDDDRESTTSKLWEDLVEQCVRDSLSLLPLNGSALQAANLLMTNCISNLNGVGKLTLPLPPSGLARQNAANLLLTQGFDGNMLSRKTPSVPLPVHGTTRQATNMSNITRHNSPIQSSNFKTEEAWVDEMLHGLGLQKVQSETGKEDDTTTNTTNKPDLNSTALLTDVPDISAEWSYHAEYSGDVYTVKWESDILLQLNNSIQVSVMLH